MAPALALALLLAAPSSVTPEFEALVKKSMAAYNLGYFDEALKEAEEAYRLNQVPALLFNLGQCHRSLGHWERAEFFYKSYLRNNPNARNEELVLGLIDKMEAKEKEAAAAPPPPAAAPPPAPAPSLIVVEAAPTPAPAAAINPAPVAEAHATSAGAPSRVWPWVLGGGAVVFTGAAIWGWYEAASFSSYKTSSTHTLAQVTGQQTLATAGEVTGIAGAVVAAALLTGAVLTW